MKTIINEIIPESFLWWSILLLSIAICYVVGVVIMRKFYRLKRDPNFDYNVPLIKKLTNIAYAIIGLTMIELGLIFKLSSISSITGFIVGVIAIISWLMGYRKYIRNNN